PEAEVRVALEADQHDRPRRVPARTRPGRIPKCQWHYVRHEACPSLATCVLRKPPARSERTSGRPRAWPRQSPDRHQESAFAAPFPPGPESCRGGSADRPRATSEIAEVVRVVRRT